MIYTAAKKPPDGHAKQIVQVNQLLRKLGIISHQYTNTETSNAGGSALLNQFAAGDYQVLTAMKVLGEGVDIPATRTAYLMAASSVRREWIQRRGR